jgi:hypothetical protein
MNMIYHIYSSGLLASHVPLKELKMVEGRRVLPRRLLLVNEPAVSQQDKILPSRRSDRQDFLASMTGLAVSQRDKTVEGRWTLPRALLLAIGLHVSPKDKTDQSMRSDKQAVLPEPSTLAQRVM